MTTSNKGPGMPPAENDRFRLLFDATADALFLSDMEGRFVEVNQAACDSLGFTREELLQRSVLDIEVAITPEALAELRARISQGEKITWEGAQRRKDGSTFPVEVRLYTFKYEGRPHVLASARDVTERHRAEEALRSSESFLNRIIDQSPYPMWISDSQGTLIRVNQALLNLLKITTAEVVGKYNVFQDNIVAEQGLFPLLRQVFEKGETVKFELTYDTSRLETIPLETHTLVILDVTVSPILDGRGEVTNAVFQHVDITQRKHAEAALAESEQRFSTFMDFLPAAVFIKDQTGRLLFANRYLKELFGWEDCLGKTTEELLPPELAALMIEDDQRALAEGSQVIQEKIIDRHGEKHFFDTYKFPVMSEGASVLLGGVAVDVTARRRAVDALELSEKKYRSFYQSILDGFGRADMTGKIVENNQGFLDMLGYTQEEIQDLRYQDITPAKWHQFEADIIEQQVLTRGYSDTYEKEYIRKDGTIFPVELRTYLVEDDTGTPIGMWAFIRDITERKRADAALRESEERYRSLFQNNHTVMLLIDPATGAIMDANPAACHYYGFSKKKLLALNITDLNLLSPEQVFRIMQQVKAGKRKRYEFQHRLANGDIRDVEVFTGHIRLKSQDLLFSIVHDITARKKAEEALRKGEKKYRSLYQEFQGIMNAVPDILCLLSPDLRIVWGNETTAQALPSKQLSDVLGQHCYPLRHERSEPCENCPVLRCFISGKVETEEVVSFGDIYELRAVPLYDDHGELRGAIEVARNITERKQAEERLLVAQERLELALQGADLGTWDWNVKTGAVTFNSRAVEILGYNLDEIEPHLDFWKKRVHPDDLPKVLENLNAHLESRTPFYEAEYRLRHKTGEWVWVLDKGKVIGRDTRGQAVRACGTHLDITERKQAEEALRESEERLRLALQAANQGLYDLNIQTLDIKVTPEYATMLGYDPAEFQETTGRWLERLHPDDREEVEATYLAYARGDLPEFAVEFRQRTKSGDWKWLLSRGKIVAWDEDGQPLRLLGTHTDITARKQAEEALRKTEAKFRQVVESSPLPMGISNASLEIEYLNPKFLELFGYTLKDMPHVEDWFRLAYPDPDYRQFQWDIWEQAIKRVREDGAISVREAEITCKDGSQRIMQILSTLMGDKSLVVFNDLTERKQAEIALQNSERRLAELIDFLPDATFAIDQEGKVIAWNRAIEEMTGVDAEDIIGKDNYEYTLPFYGIRRPALIDLVFVPNEEIEKKYDFVKKEGDMLLAETEVHLKGETQFVWAKTRPLYNGEGKIIGAIEAIRDITEQKRADQALRESEARFRLVVESSPVPLAIAEEDGVMEYVNPKFVETFGYTLKDIPRLEDWYRLAYPDLEYREKAIKNWRKTLRKAIRKGRPTETIEVEVSCKDGTRKTINIIGALVGEKTLGVFQDITARKRAEEEQARLEDQMREVQKLESLGVLAGGIAHDFNNLLMSILGNADLALLGLSPASPARPNVEEIARASQRAADLCRQMLAYSGKGRFVVGRYDLSEIVQEMAQMLKVSVSKKAILRYSFAANLPAVEVDATQIRQIIMNLITNASEAIGEQGGAISISTGVMDCDRAYLSESYLDEKLPEGRYVFLEVADTGSGMDDETRRRIFDPFYTTKFTGRGLGLAAVLGIVRGHRGAIKVYSESGKGTIFKILLPAVAWKPGDRMPQAAPAAAPQYRGTILLIDDDAHVRHVAKEMLGRLGLKVLTAAHGREGLEIFRARGREIDCVLLDLTMPGMGGEEAFQELRRLRRDVRVVLSSGYDEQDATQQFVGKGLAGFIQKPYTVAKLQEVFARVLGPLK